eukprot:Ihof_evm8s307 gene=Ihof_evmTU8s307
MPRQPIPCEIDVNKSPVISPLLSIPPLHLLPSPAFIGGEEVAMIPETNQNPSLELIGCSNTFFDSIGKLGTRATRRSSVSGGSRRGSLT